MLRRLHAPAVKSRRPTRVCVPSLPPCCHHGVAILPSLFPSLPASRRSTPPAVASSARHHPACVISRPLDALARLRPPIAHALPLPAHVPRHPEPPPGAARRWPCTRACASRRGPDLYEIGADSVAAHQHARREEEAAAGRGADQRNAATAAYFLPFITIMLRKAAAAAYLLLVLIVIISW